jgi:suppressor for copper-sensitivity B
MWQALMRMFAIRLTLLAALLSPAIAAAQDESEVRLVAATNGVGDLSSQTVGLHFTMRPGWKIYWRSPGDAGLPPQVDWAASNNLAGAEIAWPVPERFVAFGIESFGYSDEVVLPVSLTLDRPGEPLQLKAAVNYLVCREICIPREAELALHIPKGPAAPGVLAGLIARHAARVPGDAELAGARLESAKLGGSAATPLLQVAFATREAWSDPDLFVEGPRDFLFGRPTASFDATGRNFSLSVPVLRVGRPDAALAGETLTLTLVSGERAVETRITLGASAGAYERVTAMLLIALLGGMILNFMPCVLPVLSLKLMAFAGHARAAAATRNSALAAGLGILASFLLLALGAIALKKAGIAVGWGMQFQEPLFVTAMAALLLLFAANLWGFFEFGLPGRVADAAVALGDRKAGYGRDFLGGVFATLLATPCSAPFVGTAIGFALPRGAFEILSIFAAMGLGMSAPYFVIVAAPRLVAFLPRPGGWMRHMRSVLGLLLVATSLWLLWVLAGQTGERVAFIVSGLFTAVLVVLWQSDRLRRMARLVAPATAAALILGALAAPSLAPAPVIAAAQSSNWIEFDRARIPGLVTQNKVVFVDVTADWCLTCRVNKTAVLERGAVRERLHSAEVVAMRADWTRPDPAISRFLSEFGRYGIPFNVVFGPGAPAGIALPELLTAEATLAAFDRASRLARP